MIVPASDGAIHANRVTGSVVLDLTDPAASWASTVGEEGGNRWMVVCRHHCLASSPELSMAKWLAAHPREFCEEHR